MVRDLKQSVSTDEAALFEFYDRYAAALTRRDLDGVLACLNLPLVVRLPEETVFIRERVEMASKNLELFEQYDRLSVVQVICRPTSLRRLSGGSATCTAEWTLIDKDAMRLPSTEIPYILENSDEGWKVVALDLADRVNTGRALGW